MTRIIKNTLLDYIPMSFEIEKEINPARILVKNNYSITGKKIIYLCEREIRAKDNFALNFAVQKSKEQNSALKIVHPKNIYEHKPKQNFINKQLKQVQNSFDKLNIDFEIINRTPSEIIKNTMK